MCCNPLNLLLAGRGFKPTTIVLYALCTFNEASVRKEIVSTRISRYFVPAVTVQFLSSNMFNILIRPIKCDSISPYDQYIQTRRLYMIFNNEAAMQYN